MDIFNPSILIGGVAFFFFGLRSAKKGLELVVGDRLRHAMTRLAANRFTAFIFGIFATIMLQSSGATSAMLVSFTSSGILTLFQAAAVMLGSDIGTTFVAILLSIRQISDFSLTIVSAGLIVELLAKRRVVRDFGSIILGFGLIFYGMQLMTQAAEPLKTSDVAMKVFEFLSGHPIATIVFAAIVSGALHSAGTIGIAIALAFAGTITFEAAIPIVLGANVGTCITAVMAGFGSGAEGRRVAVAHVITKLAGIICIYPFIREFAGLVGEVDHVVNAVFTGFQAGVAAKIAIAHILFNTALAAIFLPLLKPLIALVKIIWPEKEEKKKPFGPKYLDKSALETPALAFAQARREIMRIGATAQWLFSDCLRMFSRGEDFQEEVSRIREEDDKIDVLEKAVRFYLAEIATERLSTEQAGTQMALLSIASDFEEIGDIMSHELTRLAAKKGKGCRIFSDEGWKDLKNFQTMVLDNFNLMLSMLAQPSDEILKKMERHEEHMNDVEQELRHAHLTRLHQGLKESFETSSIHMDILANLRRINSKLTRISQMAMQIG